MKNEKTPSLPIWARIVLIIVSYIVFSAIFLPIGFLLTGVPLDDPTYLKSINVEQTTIIQIFSLLATTISVFVFRKFLDLRSIKSLGFTIKGAGFNVILGFIVAILMIGGGSLFLYYFGNIEIAGLKTEHSHIIMGFALFIMVSLNEELLFRGYILNNLLTTMNWFRALIISSVLFTLLHLLNSNLTLLSLLNLFLAGILLGSTYLYSKNLWFPLSLHLFWNFFQGPILGYAVSGRKIESIFVVHPIGNKAISGGQFGFEGSIVCTVLTLLVSFLLIFWYRRKYTTQKIIASGN